MKQVVIQMPYGDSPVTGIESGEEGASPEHAVDDLVFLRDSLSAGDGLEGELQRVITAAAGLFALNAGTMAECIATAVVWERG